MESEPRFQEQISNWLESIGFRCEEMAGNVPEIGRIKIFRGNEHAMQLILVHLGKWLNEGLSQKLQSTFEDLANERAAGNQCVIVWEDYWTGNPEIVKSRLSAMLGQSYKIPARLTIARRIEKKDAAGFLESNHLNGSVMSKFRYGLFLPSRCYRVLAADFEADRGGDELLVAVATFSHPRIFNQEEKTVRSYELIRFASLLHTNVMGGLDKLLNVFVKDRQPDDIMTYADLEWSEGASYRKLGFEMRGQAPPIAFNLDLNTMTRTSKSTNAEGLVTVYNAGSIKYVKPFAYAS